MAVTTEDPGAATLSPVERDEVLRVLDEFAWVAKFSPEPVTDTYTYTLQAEMFRAAAALATRLRAPVAPAPDDRLCACHPSEAPVPCAKQYALSDCQAVAAELKWCPIIARYCNCDPRCEDHGEPEEAAPVAPAPIEPDTLARVAAGVWAGFLCDLEDILPHKHLARAPTMEDAEKIARAALAAIPKPAPAPADEEADFEQAAHKAFTTGVVRRVVAPAPADTVPVSREWLENLRADPWSRLTYIEAEIDRLLAEGARR